MVNLEGCGLEHIPPRTVSVGIAGGAELVAQQDLRNTPWCAGTRKPSRLQREPKRRRAGFPGDRRTGKTQALGLAANRLFHFPHGVLGRMRSLKTLDLRENYLDPSAADTETQRLLCRIAPSSWQQLIPQKIAPFLFLGGVIATSSPEMLSAMGIKRVVSVGVRPAATSPDFEYRFYPFHDEPAVDISTAFVPAARFINEAVSSGSGVLVHCQEGISRSVTIVCAYLMLYESMSLADALGLVRSVRMIASPNPGFMRLLADYGVALDSV